MPKFMEAEAWKGVYGHAFVQKVGAGEEFDPLLALDWCHEEFGDGENGRWDLQMGMIFIHDPDDAFLFKLRWC